MCPSVNSDHDIQRNLMWSPAALCAGYPSVALRYSTYQMSPRSAKNVELNILRGKGTYLKHSTARKHEGILSLVFTGPRIESSIVLTAAGAMAFTRAARDVAYQHNSVSASLNRGLTP